MYGQLLKFAKSSSDLATSCRYKSVSTFPSGWSSCFEASSWQPCQAGYCWHWMSYLRSCLFSAARFSSAVDSWIFLLARDVPTQSHLTLRSFAVPSFSMFVTGSPSDLLPPNICWILGRTKILVKKINLLEQFFRLALWKEVCSKRCFLLSYR